MASGVRATTPAPGGRKEHPATPGSKPSSYGYRRIHALLKRRGVTYNPKTVWPVLRRRGWLSTSRRRIIRSGRRHDGRVQVSEPNRRWASDITSIRAWDVQKGRLAIMIDCADRMVLAWRFATRMTADDLTELLREAIWHCVGEARPHTRGIEFFSDNGPEHISHRFRPFVRAMGLIPCHTPRRSPESNGLAEAYFWELQTGLCLSGVSRDGGRHRAATSEVDTHYNHQAPHSALVLQSPAEYYAGWLGRNKTRPVQN